jgi:hypothetical protein
MKDYWKDYSGIDEGNHTLYINTSNGDWGFFTDDEFVCEGCEGLYPSELVERLYIEFHLEE